MVDLVSSIWDLFSGLASFISNSVNFITNGIAFIFNFFLNVPKFIFNNVIVEFPQVFKDGLFGVVCVMILSIVLGIYSKIHS